MLPLCVLREIDGEIDRNILCVAEGFLHDNAEGPRGNVLDNDMQVEQTVATAVWSALRFDDADDAVVHGYFGLDLFGTTAEPGIHMQKG